MTVIRRNPFPQPNKFRDFVTNELIRRKSLPNAGHPEIAMPFGRFTSALQSDIKNYQFFSLGLSSIIEKPSESMFELTYGSKDVVGYATDKSRSRVPIAVEDANRPNETMALGANPTPGITQIVFDQMTSVSGIRCDITWTCYDESQLEFLRPHFMTPGVFCIVEWGQLFSHASDVIPPLTALDFTDASIINKLSQYLQTGRRDVITDLVEPSKGNYDLMVGTVGNFRLSMANSNKYEVVTTVYGVSEVVYGLASANTVVWPSQSGNRKTSIHEFFARDEGSQFNKLIRENTNDVQKVFITNTNEKSVRQAISTPSENPAVESRIADNDVAALQDPTRNLVFNDTTDNIYISMWFFINIILNGPDGVFSFFNFWNNDRIKALKNLDINNNDRTVPGVSGLGMDIDEPFIGNHALLYTLEPETVMIVRDKPLAHIDIQTLNENFKRKFMGNGLFADDTETDTTLRSSRGKLSRGIWVSTNCITECFLTTNSFMEAIQKLLDRLNNASGNYWELSLYFNDDFNAYQIVDRRGVGSINRQQQQQSDFYVFNQGIKSELLGLELNANLSSLEASQAAIMAGSVNRPDYAVGDNSYANNTLISTALFGMTDLLKAARGAGSGSNQVFNTSQDNRNSSVVTNSNSSTTPSAQQATVDGATSLSSPLGTQDPIQVNGLGGLSGRRLINVNNRTLDHFHVGVDIHAAAGSSIFAAADGKVLTEGFRKVIRPQAQGTEDVQDTDGFVFFGADNFTRTIGVEHDDGITLTVYRHLNKSTNSYQSARVKRGDLIGIVATHTEGDPHSQGPHLHFEVYRKNSDGVYEWQDPLDALNATMQNLTPGQISKRVETQNNRNAYLTSPSNDGIPVNFAADADEASNVDAGIRVSSQDREDIALRNEGRNPEQERERRRVLLEDYGFQEPLLYFAYLSLTQLRNAIYGSAQSDLQTGRPNSFTAPVPTQSYLSLALPGLSGFSVSDGFYVDKIPRSFRQLGYFIITSYKHTITATSWKTLLNGMFVFTGAGTNG